MQMKKWATIIVLVLFVLPSDAFAFLPKTAQDCVENNKRNWEAFAKAAAAKESCRKRTQGTYEPKLSDPRFHGKQVCETVYVGAKACLAEGIAKCDSWKRYEQQMKSCRRAVELFKAKEELTGGDPLGLAEKSNNGLGTIRETHNLVGTNSAATSISTGLTDDAISRTADTGRSALGQLDKVMIEGDGSSVTSTEASATGIQKNDSPKFSASDTLAALEAKLSANDSSNLSEAANILSKNLDQSIEGDSDRGLEESANRIAATSRIDTSKRTLRGGQTERRSKPKRNPVKGESITPPNSTLALKSQKTPKTTIKPNKRIDNKERSRRAQQAVNYAALQRTTQICRRECARSRHLWAEFSNAVKWDRTCKSSCNKIFDRSPHAVSNIRLSRLGSGCFQFFKYYGKVSIRHVCRTASYHFFRRGNRVMVTKFRGTSNPNNIGYARIEGQNASYGSCSSNQSKCTKLAKCVGTLRPGQSLSMCIYNPPL